MPRIIADSDAKRSAADQFRACPYPPHAGPVSNPVHRGQFAANSPEMCGISVTNFQVPRRHDSAKPTNRNFPAREPQPMLFARFMQRPHGRRRPDARARHHPPDRRRRRRRRLQPRQFGPHRHAGGARFHRPDAVEGRPEPHQRQLLARPRPISTRCSTGRKRPTSRSPSSSARRSRATSPSTSPARPPSAPCSGA